ncbi:hypothetical protein FOZ62_011240 [Perkinsus olseni]|uniref:Uncharacterized protein n=1 Tax=Perkinsus olseni TaxID=32597 RepID=A0A7J6S3A6_PEROL|nr:hypothetical protein FOZ62_011240 [Perkinsus olseni]
MGNTSITQIMDPLSLCQNPPLPEDEQSTQSIKASSDFLLPLEGNLPSIEPVYIPPERAVRAFFAIHRDIAFDRIYRKVKALGKGSYGDVYLAEEIDAAGRLVAVKELVDGSSPAEEGSAIRCYSTEISALSALPPHPRIIRVFEAFENDGGMYQIVMEPCWGGELYDHIVHTARKRPSMARGLPEAEASSLMRQVLEALAFVHARHIVHRDVKAENFLFVDENDRSRLKLCDFGAAASLRAVAGGKAEGRIGTLSYAAPEVYRSKGADTRSDMWSAGVVLYVMLCAASPFRQSGDRSTKVVVHRVKAGSFIRNRPAWHNLSEAAADLVTRLLIVEPSQRLTAAEALRHPFIRAASPSNTLCISTPSTRRKLGRYLALPPQRKELLRTAASLVPESQLGDMSRLFAAADLDHDGRVDLIELDSLVIGDGMNPSSLETASSMARDHSDRTFDYLDFIVAIDGAVTSEKLNSLSPAIARSSRSCGFLVEAPPALG